MASRIRRLWIETDRRVPGRVDEMEARIAGADGDEDGLDELASIVVRRGGEARVADPEAMPTRTGIAAQLR